MATSLTTAFNLDLSWSYANNDGSGRLVKDDNSVSLVDTWANGTGLEQGNIKFHDQRTVNDAANDDLDLAGSLVDSFGNTITFAKVKVLAVKNTNTTAGHNLVMGGAAANAFGTYLGGTNPSITIGPTGVLYLVNPSLAGYAVTAGTGDILRFTGSGGNITYDVVLIGTTA